MSARAAAPLSLIRRHFRARPRLFASIAIGVVIGLLLPGRLSPTLRAILAWDGGAAVYLALVAVMAMRATPATMRDRAAREDEARWVILAMMAAVAFFAMFTILGLMREAKATGGIAATVETVLAGLTILLSWSLAHTVFAIHYAHDFFNDLADEAAPGLAFPAEHSDPDYWDFLYFSFVIGMTAQVSDVQVLTQPWRRLVLAHGLLSFLFNTVVLALSINLLAGFF
ncbi:MAG TPA: DUF1345 domain-containing protein [Stellaceae bacterium]|nr:DUF1345 domain-containing protein [Stellaceae bacterium]